MAENASSQSTVADVPHFERACELLWEAGHPRIAEALQKEVEALSGKTARLERVLFPKVVADS